MTNVAVRRDRQREGIGNFLMESMIRLAEERGITMIHLEVRAGNETAIRLYERQDLCEMACERDTIQIPQRMLFL